MSQCLPQFHCNYYCLWNALAFQTWYYPYYFWHVLLKILGQLYCSFYCRSRCQRYFPCVTTPAGTPVWMHPSLHSFCRVWHTCVNEHRESLHLQNHLLRTQVNLSHQDGLAGLRENNSVFKFLHYDSGHACCVAMVERYQGRTEYRNYHNWQNIIIITAQKSQ